MRHFLAVLTALCVASVLAGCGGSNGRTAAPPPTPPVPAPSPLSYATDLDDSVARLTALSAADTEDGSALGMAKKYSAMIGTLAVDGNSSAAMTNAQKVLDARKSLQDALAAVETDRKEAMTAKSGLPADADPAIAKILDKSIQAADAAITEAKAVLDAADSVSGSLASYVKLVSDADSETSPASIGKDVAMAVSAALAPTDSNNGAGLRVTHGTETGQDLAAEANRFQTDDHQGMTWAEIVGADNLTDRRIATGAPPGSTRVVKVASVAGMKAADVFGANHTLTDENKANGAETTDTDTGATNTTYMGIPGTVICGGADCDADTGGTLTGSWYFTPASPTTPYVKLGDATTYSADVMYARYGHWLVVDTGSGDVTVNTFATTASDGTNTSNLSLGAGADDTATYNGSAAGRSVHRTTNADGVMTDIQSGRFTADVTLTAKFGDDPKLGGTVVNFRGVDNANAVDSAWTVTLEEANWGSDASVTDGETSATDQSGTWSAQAYGTANQRPTGVYGGFNAHFTDGHVAGAYAVR